MKRERADWADHAIAILIVIILWVVVTTVIDAAKAHAEMEPMAAPEPWKPPPIPVCDKETWLRITEGCHD